MTEKDYCDYDTAEKLRELGYPDNNLIPLYEAEKWLGEEHDIHIEPFLCNLEYAQYKLNIVGKPKGNTRYCSIYNSLMEDAKNKTYTYFNSFEEALLEGIKKAIKILKEEK